MVTQDLSEVAVEFNSILENTSKDITNKIPNRFKAFFKSIESPNYMFEYDKRKTLNEQELKSETKGLIVLVYQEYICEGKEKESYKQYCSEVLRQHEESKRNLYSVDNNTSLNNQANTIDKSKEKDPDQLALIEKREDRWYSRIFSKRRSM